MKCRKYRSGPTPLPNFFDQNERLTGTYLETSVFTVLDYAAYGYNQANQRTALTNAAGTNGFTYDKIDQLTIATSSTTSADRGYAYDAAFNLTWVTNNGSPSQYVVNSLNELAAANSNTNYDENGNLTNDANAITYSYDDENRLISVFDGVNHTYRSDFVYDGLSRVRERLDYGWGTGASPLGAPPPPSASWHVTNTVQYIYDGNRVIMERDGSGNPLTAYTRGPDLSGSLEGAGGIGGLLARSDGYSSGNWADHNFYHADGNGNITYLENSSQGMAATYRYDPYGNTISSSGTLASANTYRFSSKEINTGSGMYYYLYRFYNPGIQRWLNRDPIGELGGRNLYYFVANSPINLADDNGRKWFVTGFPPPRNQPTVVCKGGKPVPHVPTAYTGPELLEITKGPNQDKEIKGYLCALKCSHVHEQSHVTDILAQDPNICQGPGSEGSTVANDQINGELLASEQRAYQKEAGCLADCAKSCPSNAVKSRQKSNSDWITEHQWE